MKQIRKNVFETNSSSTHTLAICTEDEYKKWQEGKMLFNKWNETFIKNSINITKQDKVEAEERYNTYKGKYYKDWSELTEAERDEYTYNYIAQQRRQEKSFSFEEDGLTYQEFMQDCSNGGLETETSRYTSPSGDKLVITCAYGYN
jgi:hypothetical protein|nr:MAG TPA: hypothetical protein [Bacteriophage sp.]